MKPLKKQPYRFMRRLFPGRFLSRKRLTIASLMILVAVAASVINGLRPLTRYEATRTADRHFKTIPGASSWIGSYEMHPWQGSCLPYGEIWTVDFKDSASGEMLAQINVTSRGMVFGVGVQPQKLASKNPAGASRH